LRRGAKLGGKKVWRKDWVRETALDLIPLPCWQELGEDDRRAKVGAMSSRSRAASSLVRTPIVTPQASQLNPTRPT
jgi:hypothetical protein